MLNEKFWRDKKVFITGHTGFKGGWLSLWLTKMGAKVKGYSLSPSTNPSLFDILNLKDLFDSEINDIRDQGKLSKSIHDFAPDLIFHMAAQPLVRLSYINPVETFETNVIGTANLLEASRKSQSIKSVIIITTDKCYKNDGRSNGYNEDDPMGGRDPYSSSKGCAELVTSSYRDSYFDNLDISLSSVRAGNVIGGGDWSQDRLIPDILNSFSNGNEVILRNPDSTRPWQYVLEPLRGYLYLAEKMEEDPKHFASSYNFGPNQQDVKSVRWIADKMSENWPKSKWVKDTADNPHEEKYLSLEISKAESLLNWIPIMNIESTLNNIIDWHNSFNQNSTSMQEYSLNEIHRYEKLLNKNTEN